MADISTFSAPMEPDIIIIQAFEATVDKQSITLEQTHDIVEGSKDVYVGYIELDEEWDGFAVTVLFKNEYGSQVAFLNHKNRVIISSDILRGTKLYVGLRGTKDGQVLTTSAPAVLTIKSSYTQFVEWDNIYTANQYDELMEYFNDTRDSVEGLGNFINDTVGPAIYEHYNQIMQSAAQVAENTTVVINKTEEASQSATEAKTSEENAKSYRLAAQQYAQKAQELVSTLSKRLVELNILTESEYKDITGEDYHS